MESDVYGAVPTPRLLAGCGWLCLACQAAYACVSVSHPTTTTTRRRPRPGRLRCYPLTHPCTTMIHPQLASPAQLVPESRTTIRYDPGPAAFFGHGSIWNSFVHSFIHTPHQQLVSTMHPTTMTTTIIITFSYFLVLALHVCTSHSLVYQLSSSPAIIH